MLSPCDFLPSTRRYYFHKIYLFVSLFIGLFVSRIMQIKLVGSSPKNVKNHQIGLGPTYIPLNFESDLDHILDTTNTAGDYNLHHVCAYVRACVRACVCRAVFSETTTVTHFW